MMKVLHILHELRPSGAETMLRTAAPLWMEHDVVCDVLSTGSEIGSFADALIEAGYKVHHLPLARRPAYFLRLAEFIRSRGYDVVHQHIEGAGYWFSTAALFAGAGVVRTIHNNFPFEGRLRWVRGWQRRHLARRGVVFVAIAPGVQANEQGRFGLETELVINWADDRFMQRPTLQQRKEARSALSLSDDEFVVMSLGNCSAIKNHSVVIEALARCRDLPRIRYLHVGIEDPDRTECELAHQLGVDSQVLFAGWTADSLPRLHAADAYVMPSRFEGFSIAAIEALGTGLPALLADVPGLHDLGAYFDGLVFQQPTAEGVERGLRELIGEDPTARLRRTEDYSRICLEQFSARRGVRDYAGIYARLRPQSQLASASHA